MIDGQLIGRMIRASRVRLRMRQVDVAFRAGVSRRLVSDVENGRAATVRLDELNRLANACGIRLRFELVPSRRDICRLGDGAHAELVDGIVRLLDQASWRVQVEVPSSRGSIDVLAIHPPSGSLLVVEVKSRLADLQEMLRSMAATTSVAAPAARHIGWRPTSTSALLVVGDTSTQRRVVAQHPSIFHAAFPVRARMLRLWLAAPDLPIRGLMFLPYVQRGYVIQDIAIRVRPTQGGRARPHARGQVGSPNVVGTSSTG